MSGLGARFVEGGVLASELSIGSIFAERYRIERRIASGGMGAVYEVTHLETTRRRALKVLHADFVQSDQVRARFRQEARVAAQIESEYIVDVFDAGIDTATDMPFLVMELLRGEDVRARIRRSGPMSPEETVRYLFEASLALDKTHEARIVHRDLKPDNLFLCEREHGPPRVKVLDFGISKIIAEDALLGQTAHVLGTPLYMAPEQFSISGGISPATDIYALGLIAFTMLVGKPYWAEERKKAGGVVIFALLASKGPEESAVVRAARCGITLPDTFDAWFHCITAPNPADRFPSASLAIMSLADVLGVPLPYEYTNSLMPPALHPTMPPPAIVEISPDELSPTAPAPSSSSRLHPGPTLIGSGLTAAPRVSRRGSIVAVVGVLVTAIAAALIVHRYRVFFAQIGQEPNIMATQSAPATIPPAEPIAPPPAILDSAIPLASTPAAPSATPVMASAAPIDSAAAPVNSTAPATRATSEMKAPAEGPSKKTVKPRGNVIWNND